MSCFCEKNNNESTILNCPCDKYDFPRVLSIPAGLSHFRRQIATFPEFRRAMLREISNRRALINWKARDKEDLGIMLLEMWAYVCHSLSFYDEVLAQEVYIRTSNLRPSIRKLVNIIGYLPNPAISSEVRLTTLADGKTEVKLPAGTAFRSAAFDDENPQVFELEEDRIIHPFTNSWKVKPDYKGIIKESGCLYIKPYTEIAEGSLVFIQYNSNQNSVVRVNLIEPVICKGNQRALKLTFKPATNIEKDSKLSEIKIYTTTSIATVQEIKSEKKLRLKKLLD